MITEDVDDGLAIGNDIALEVPLATQLILQQELIQACGLTIDAVIGAHHGTSFGFGDRGAKCWKVGIELVVLADLYVRSVAGRLGAAVDGVMFRRGDDTIVFWIISLHTGDEGNAQAR